MPAIKTMEAELESCREALLVAQIPYLRNELKATIRDLRLTLQRVKDASEWTALGAAGIERLELMISRGLNEAATTRDLLRGHHRLQERITHVDSDLKTMLFVVQDSSLAVAKIHRDAIVGMTRLRQDLSYEKRQMEFHRTLNELETEVRQHNVWLESMRSRAVEIVEVMETFESLRSSSAWTTTKGAEESVHLADVNLKSAVRAWQAGNWRRTDALIEEARLHIGAARNACDRTLNQAQDELVMWRDLLGTSLSYPQMKAKLESFQADLTAADLPRWVEFRTYNETQIDASASQVSRLLQQLPLRPIPPLNWKERSSASRWAFAQAVSKNCEETVSLLTNRHQRRRRRYKSPKGR